MVCERCKLLEKEIAKLQDALLWCSGSGDFAPEGIARKGWLKLCAPRLRRIWPIQEEDAEKES